jgi:hypothetical protein
MSSRADLGGSRAAATAEREAPERRSATPDLDDVRRRQREKYGGLSWTSAFFGWLVAVGLAVLLIALLSAAGAAVGLTQTSPDQAAGSADTIGIVGGILMLAVLLIAYYAGGYVAGRMARFAGARQGVAVWLWTLFVAVVGAVIATVSGAVAGPRLDELFRLPLNDGLMSGGVLSAGAAALAVGVLVVTLVGAVLGGLAGMRYHRRVDRDLVVPG